MIGLLPARDLTGPPPVEPVADTADVPPDGGTWSSRGPGSACAAQSGIPHTARGLRPATGRRRPATRRSPDRYHGRSKHATGSAKPDAIPHAPVEQCATEWAFARDPLSDRVRLVRLYELELGLPVRVADADSRPDSDHY